MKANKYLKDISNVDFAYSDIIAVSKSDLKIEVKNSSIQ